MTKVRIHSPDVGSFQFSQSPPMPNGMPSFKAMAKGCFARCPLILISHAQPVDVFYQSMRIMSAGRFDACFLFVDDVENTVKNDKTNLRKSQRNLAVRYFGTMYFSNTAGFHLADITIMLNHVRYWG